MLGTILRTAVGFQYDAIVVSNHCADIYDNRVIRAARGAHFQTGVPIYTLREEDGDNTYGMLNHVVERNELLPVCVVGQEDLPTAPSAATPIIAGAKKTPVIPSSAPRKSTLQDFCLERFTSSSSSGDNEKGYMLFAGPNHTKNMMKRITTKMKKPPVQLLVDSLPSGCDLMMTLPVAMHALRPHGDWDYLPLAEKHDPSTADLQTRRVNVDIGPDRHSVSEKDFNLDEEEQTQLANEKNAFRKWKRLRKNQMTDYDMWMTAEEKRVNEMLRNTRRQMIEPWNTEQTNKHEKGAAGMPDWVPNIIDEYRQNVDRDSLREEREMSESFRRPSNYNRP
ncbi:hypothetical protein AGDE_02895 [Angomonas deanei]|nr:hypothetical protein AGDE_02895 [Angomonas deanei]|eukprot:EPY41030.1 hypothetical protein AGDE_02895 [Angomonas deanei]